MWPRFVNIVVGLWLIAAPTVLGYVGTSPVAEASDRIAGPLIVSSAIAAIWPEIRPLRWVNVVLGTWLLVGVPLAAIAVTWPLGGIVSSVLAGALAITMGRIEGEIHARFGGGWRSIWREDIDTVTGPRSEDA